MDRTVGRENFQALARRLASGFNIGDRVEIVGVHPWAGSMGEIARDFAAPMTDIDWAVRLDHGDYPGHEVAVASPEIRKVGG